MSDATYRDPPALPAGSTLDAQTRQRLEQWREELQRLRGFRGSPLDKALTLRDFGATNIKGLLTAGQGAGAAVGPPGPAGPPGQYVEDLTPPPTPTGVVVTSGLDFVFVQTDAPTFMVGNGYGRTVVYATNYSGSGPLPTFSDAVRVHEFTGQVGSWPVEPATQVHVWVKWRTRDGVESVNPAGGTNGFQTTTGVNVANLLEALSGAIRTSELAASLAATINNADQRLARVVNYRIAAAGANASAQPGGLFNESGAQLAGASFSWIVDVLNGATGALESSTAYNLIASSSNATALANALNALNASKVVIVRTWYNPQANRLLGGVPAALKRCGATGVVINAMKLNSAYILVGIPGLGEGTGIERYAGPVDSSPDAYCEYQLQLVNGKPVGMAGYAATVFEAAARAEKDVYYSSAIDTLTASVAGVESEVQVEASARAAADGHMSAQYVVRAQLTQAGQTVAGGFGLMGTSGGTAGPTFDFGVMANRFWVGSPVGSSGVSDIQPFIVQTTPTTINGVAVPIGVYMDAAFIRNGTITEAKIGNAAITNAKIVDLNASKITAGALAVGQYIKSSNYVANTSGWLINADGSAELSNCTVRGGIVASFGSIGGNTISSAYVASPGYTPGVSGWIIKSDGTAEFGGASIRGDIQSDNFVAGSTGWRIRKSDGTAEFGAATIRGQLTTSQIQVGAVTTNLVTEVDSLGIGWTNSASSFDAAPAASNFALSSTITTNGGWVQLSGYLGVYLGCSNTLVTGMSVNVGVDLLNSSNVLIAGDVAFGAVASGVARMATVNLNAMVPLHYTAQLAPGSYRFRVTVTLVRAFNSSGTLVAPGSGSTVDLRCRYRVQENKV